LQEVFLKIRLSKIFRKIILFVCKKIVLVLESRINFEEIKLEN